MIRVALILLCLALPAQAQVLPALFDVTGVAADDTLAARVEPNASAEKLGSLRPDAKGVEVVAYSDDGEWGQINLDEDAIAWVALRYLQQQPGPDWPELTRPMKCLGTEPFWTADFDPATATLVFTDLTETKTTLKMDAAVPIFARNDRVGMLLSSPEMSGFASLRAEICADGMRDTLMGIDIDLFTRKGDQTLGLSGCCSLGD